MSLNTLRRRAVVLLASALVVTGFTACASVAPQPSQGGPSAGPVSSPTPSPTPTHEPILIQWVDFPPYPETPALMSDRDNIIKEIGQTAGQTNEVHGDIMKFMVQGITLDPVCVPGAPEPENGHFIRVDMQGEVLSALTAAYENGGYPPSLMFNSWQVIDSNGVTINGYPDTEAAIACLTRTEMIYYTDVKPGERAVGSVVLDVPVEHGTLVFTWGIGAVGGWEYNF